MRLPCFASAVLASLLMCAGGTAASLLQPGKFSALGFMHVFKSSGTTYGVALAKFARAHKIPFFTDMRQGRQFELPSFILRVNKKAKHLATDAPPSHAPFSIFHGHGVNMAFEKLNTIHNGAFSQFLPSAASGSMVPLFVVVLREPSERLMSAFLQLTAGVRHKKGAKLSMDPKTLNGGVMDKDKLDEMFTEFMEQQEVHQCRIVPNQVFGPAWATPCASMAQLEPSRLQAMEGMLRSRVLPLIAERKRESAALLDTFLGSRSGHVRVPSLSQFLDRGSRFRCSSFSNWRHGGGHAMLEKCDVSGERGASKHVTPAVRRVVEHMMGYELWLYSTAKDLFQSYLDHYGVSGIQNFKCKPQTYEGCTENQVAYLKEWAAKSGKAVSQEIERLLAQKEETPIEDEIKSLKRLALLQGLAADSKVEL